MEVLGIGMVQVGRVLARPVTNAGGVVLCPAGSRLTERVIERLRTAGIESVVVEGGHRQGPSPQERLETLNQRFKGIEDPLLLQLRAAIENRLNLLKLEQETHQDGPAPMSPPGV